MLVEPLKTGRGDCGDAVDGRQASVVGLRGDEASF